MAKTIFDFTKLTDTELDTQAENILIKMTDNALFPTPNPDLSRLSDHLDAYRSGLVTAALRDRQQVELKNQARRQLEQTLRILGLYVESVSNGDTAVILAAGYEVSRSATPVGPCPKAVLSQIKTGAIHSGQAVVHVKRDRTARMYRLEYRLAGTETWTVVQSTRSKIQLEGLDSFKQYDFRAAYIGTDPTITYSDIMSSYVV